MRTDLIDWLIWFDFEVTALSENVRQTSTPRDDASPQPMPCHRSVCPSFFPCPPFSLFFFFFLPFFNLSHPAQYLKTQPSASLTRPWPVDDPCGGSARSKTSFDIPYVVYSSEPHVHVAARLIDRPHRAYGTPRASRAKLGNAAPRHLTASQDAMGVFGSPQSTQIPPNRIILQPPSYHLNMQHGS